MRLVVVEYIRIVFGNVNDIWSVSLSSTAEACVGLGEDSFLAVRRHAERILAT
jgi:hypothetical protein